MGFPCVVNMRNEWVFLLYLLAIKGNPQNRGTF